MTERDSSTSILRPHCSFAVLPAPVAPQQAPILQPPRRPLENERIVRWTQLFGVIKLRELVGEASQRDGRVCAAGRGSLRTGSQLPAPATQGSC